MRGQCQYFATSTRLEQLAGQIVLRASLAISDYATTVAAMVSSVEVAGPIW